MIKICIKCLTLIVYCINIDADPIRSNLTQLLRETLNTRRILSGHEVGETRPYMVYLRMAMPADGKLADPNWLCGGVIIHERYILTSAACIEDAKQFYVISGTHRWVPPTVTTDECVNYGAKKAIWKCVPKTYVFDGNEFDNILWLMNDIAVVKVEDEFNFKRRIRGCEFIPKKIAFNNISDEYEKPGTVASIAGWGSTESYGDVVVGRSTVNSPLLLETNVVLMKKSNCKARWEERYHHIIENSMICAKDNMDGDAMSVICSENEVNCKELVYSDEDVDPSARRQVVDPGQLVVHTAEHANQTRRTKVVSGGFCENDHGGPLVAGQGTGAVVIGIISACLTRDLSHRCYGPYLYTSVWRNRHLISCAIDKEIGATCKRMMRAKTVETTFVWSPLASEPEFPRADPPKAVHQITPITEGLLRIKANVSKSKPVTTKPKPK